MDFNARKTQAINATTLRAIMQPRYWEDATVDGVEECDEAPTIPLRDGDLWILRIDLQSGRIDGWPQGVTAKTHYKVCDAGTYSLLDEDGEVLAEIEGYVPNMLGGGDYAKLSIDANGMIEGWVADLSPFECVQDISITS